MAKLQKNYTLDTDSLLILEELGPRDKSEFIRKAIKFYHHNKDANFQTNQPNLLENLEIEL